MYKIQDACKNETGDVRKKGRSNFSGYDGKLTIENSTFHENELLSDTVELALTYRDDTNVGLGKA